LTRTGHRDCRGSPHRFRRNCIAHHLSLDAALRRVSTGVVVPPNWFVTFEIRKRGLLLKKERSPRETHTFATEAEAKVFAQTKFEEGLVVFAGTINPHSPKRLILASDIAGWLVEESEPLRRSKDRSE
jgi:hypothetical protein